MAWLKRGAVLVPFAVLLLIATSASAVDTLQKHSAIKPEPRNDGWMNRHKSFNKRASEGNVDLVFIGDSITEGWESDGKAAWDKHFAKWKPMNLGISGDRTQHVLWRLDHGNLEGISPKVAVLMIGTNNSNAKDNTAEEIADGIKAIIHKLRATSPETKVLVLAIFPRSEKPDAQREKNARASKLASEVADDETVYYLDIGERFVSPDGKISKEIMPDYLHLSPKGYEIWAEAVEPKIAVLMK